MIAFSWGGSSGSSGEGDLGGSSGSFDLVDLGGEADYDVLIVVLRYGLRGLGLFYYKLFNMLCLNVEFKQSPILTSNE